MDRINKIIREIISEKKKKRDRCLRIADRKFKKPSAYKSGNVVKCRKGMIWKDLKEEELTEAKQVGVIYHYTDQKGLDGILQSNSIKSNKEYYMGNELDYISFTRNKNFHKKGMKFDVKTEYRIAIDGNKLSNNYKIEPFAYLPGWDYIDSWEYDWLEDEPESVVRDFFNQTGDYDEQEERISFKKPSQINNIKKYIIQIDKVSDLKETDDPQSSKAAPYGSGYSKLKDIIREIILEDESLHKWFARKGTPGKKGGWVDCNAPIRKDGKVTGYKACGREKGEKRAKYPSCRPTPAKCKDKGKGTKWGKTK